MDTASLMPQRRCHIIRVFMDELKMKELTKSVHISVWQHSTHAKIGREELTWNESDIRAPPNMVILCLRFCSIWFFHLLLLANHFVIGFISLAMAVMLCAPSFYQTLCPQAFWQQYLSNVPHSIPSVPITHSATDMQIVCECVCAVCKLRAFFHLLFRQCAA